MLPGLAGYLLFGYGLRSFEDDLITLTVTQYGHEFSGSYLSAGEPQLAAVAAAAPSAG